MAYDLSQLSVLVGDEDSFVLSMTRSLLNGFGITNIRLVTDSHLVLDELFGDPVDVLLVDWNLAPMNGIELTRYVRNDPESPNRYLPVIIMTGHTELSTVIQARDTGVNEILAKPMSVRSMYQRLLSVMERPRPFVRSATYFGPDRRRVDDPRYKGPDRRASLEDQIEI